MAVEEKHPRPAKWRRRSRKDAVIKVFLEFCEMSSVHGVRFLGDSTVGIIAKIMWVVALVLCATNLCVRTLELTQLMATYSTEIKVLSTRADLEDVHYPSVMFCPATPIARSRAMELLINHLESNFPLNTFNFQDRKVMKELNETYERLLEYYGTISPNTKAKDMMESVLRDAFNELDLREFFRKATPTCEEMFAHCEWHRTKINCCAEIQPQETYFGLCYTFNSLVTVPRKNCTEASPSDTGVNAACFIHHSTVTGGFSGLTVAMKQRTDNALKMDDGFFLAISAPTRSAKRSELLRVHYKTGILTQFALSTILTNSAPEIASIPLASRECHFRHEPYGDFKLDTVGTTYSKYNCDARCIALKTVKHCDCRPHTIEAFLADGQGPVCNFTHLSCIAKLMGREPMLLHCDCKPRCDDENFIAEIMEKASEFNDSVVDVFYWSGMGLMTYQRQLTMNTSSAIVYFGGMAGLLLGCSVLSIAELLYYVGRIVSQLLAPTSQVEKKLLKKGRIFRCSAKTQQISTFPWNP